MATPRFSADDDAALRVAAMEWLAARSHDGTEPISSEEIFEFTFRGEPFALMDRQAGIRKPAALNAALSFRTAYRPDGAARPYEDRIADDGLIHYKWNGIDPQHPHNRGLRAAMQNRLPLIWFYGVAKALWLPTFPVYLVGEVPDQHEFVVDVATEGELRIDTPIEVATKRYLITETKRRLHQPVFRASVMAAYQTQCAVCSLRHAPLLDAAHIVPDSHEAGIASVRNGLALCKIHHAAFDAKILGIRPAHLGPGLDHTVQIRHDLLAEVDGPMLQHGLQEVHAKPLRVVPRAPSQRPDPDLLESAYAAFCEADRMHRSA